MNRNRLLAAGLLLALVAGFTACTAMQAGPPQLFPIGSPTQNQDPTRPVLVWTNIKGQTPKTRASVVAINSDGRILNTFEPAFGAVWAPEGGRFALFEGQNLSVMTLEGTRRVLFTFAATEKASDTFLPGTSPAWSPDGKQVGYISAKGESIALVILEVQTGLQLSRHELTQASMASYCKNFRWSPDGQRILLSCRHLIVVDVRTGKTDVISQTESAAADWAPGGGGVFYLEEGIRGLSFRHLASSTAISLENTRRPPNFWIEPVFGGIAVSPSGALLAVAGARNLRIYQIESTARILSEKPIKNYAIDEIVLDLEWSPDQSRLVIATNPEAKLQIINLNDDSSKTVGSLAGPAVSYKVLSWAR